MRFTCDFQCIYNVLSIPVVVLCNFFNPYTEVKEVEITKQKKNVMTEMPGRSDGDQSEESSEEFVIVTQPVPQDETLPKQNQKKDQNMTLSEEKLAPKQPLETKKADEMESKTNTPE